MSATLNRIGSVIVRKPWLSGPPSSARIFSSSALEITGDGSATWWAASGPGSSRLASGPMDRSVAMMISSRIASTGGLVTCAKSCLK